MYTLPIVSIVLFLKCLVGWVHASVSLLILFLLLVFVSIFILAAHHPATICFKLVIPVDRVFAIPL